MDDGKLTLRSYRLAFELERRIHRIDRFRIPVPYGLPLDALGYAVGVGLVIVVLSGTPFIGTILALLPWPIRLLFVPGVAAHLLCRVRSDRRPAHEAIKAYIRFQLRPKRLAGMALRRRAPSIEWNVVPVVPDERGPVLRAGRLHGPATVLVRQPGRAEIRRRVIALEQTVDRPMLRPRPLELRPGETLEVPMRAPLTFAWRNVVFARDVNDPWALYRVHTESYSGLTTAGKVEVLGRLAGFACTVESDFQLLRVSRAWSAADYAAAARASLDARHGRTDLLDDLIAKHERVLTDERALTSEVVLAIRLGDGAARGVLADLRRACGLLDASGISQRRLDEVLDAESRAFGRAGDYLDVERLSSLELQWLVRRASTRGLGEPWLDQFWRPQALVLDAQDEDGGRRFEPLEADLMRLVDEPVTIARDHLQIGDTFQATLVTGALPETTVFPGRQSELLFAPLEALAFPVDACLGARWISNDHALALVRRRIVDADHAFAEENLGEHGPTSRTATRPDLARELEEELTTSDRPPLLRSQLSLVVGAPSVDELHDRVRLIRREFAPITLHLPKDVQLELWAGHLPAQLPRLRRYDDILLPEQFGAMVPTATHAVGARTGLLIGHTLSGSRPVLFDVTEGSRTSRAPAVLCTGTLGSGKTLTAQLLALHGYAGGSQVIDVDPKGDHKLTEIMPSTDVEQVELTADGRHRGRLDPLRIGPDDLQVELAFSFLTELLPAPVPPTWQTEIRAAVADVVGAGGRSTGLVVDRLARGGSDALAAARAIEVHASSGLLQLGFADRAGTDDTPAQRPVVSLRIANLTLPVPGTPKGDLTQEERTGRALLRLLAVQALHLASTDWSRHKVLVVEELSQLVSDAVGLSLLQRIVRLCRSQNATPILVTQVVGDVGGVADMVGCFFAFGVETDTEAERVLRMLGMDAGDRALRAQLRSFRRGRCFMRDYEGRVSPMRIDLADESLLRALDTTPRRPSAAEADARVAPA